MRLSENWKDYELIDASDGERLERWGNIILIRPDPQIIWSTEKKNPLWYSAHARYHRSNKGGGNWEQYKKIPAQWSINYGSLTFNIKPMGFKHTGVFPEQAVNWDFAAEKIKKEGRPLKILNLFGYTGCATLACMKAGASVCHVDASKGMVQWAKENAVSSNIADKPVRWLVDDCAKFVQREIRRGNRYDGIIMDPPSYGRVRAVKFGNLRNSSIRWLNFADRLCQMTLLSLFLIPIQQVFRLRLWSICSAFC